MKRILLSVVGTVVVLVALLSFKSHSTPLGVALPGTGGTGSTGLRTHQPGPAHRTGAPPGPRNSSARQNGPSRKFVGRAVQTPYGVVQVAITVAGGRITDVTLPKLTAFDQTSQMINSQAAPLLVHETLSRQTGRLDTVSGATYTSDGYLQSLQSALNEAGLR